MDSIWKNEDEKDLLPKVKPCPCCGGFAKLERKSKTIIQGEQKYVTYVRCVDCDMRGPRVLLGTNNVTLARQVAIKRWNRRVGEDED